MARKEQGWQKRPNGVYVRKVKSATPPKPKTTARGLTGQARKAAENIKKASKRVK